MSNSPSSLSTRNTTLSSADCSGLRELMASKKVRITPLRERVYNFVSHAKEKGISAYQILELMKKYNPNAKPATVYRSLDYLQQAGVIVKIEYCSKFIKKNNLSPDVVTIFLICSNCGIIIQHTDKLIHTYIEEKAIDYGCAVQKKDIEVKVICPECRGKI
ncbi:Fur family transcriptional regulator [Enterobacter kobei]|uniref:Fur family transcriptional regulator n=1 Tax=Enterobacter kobei TaxID=208224 RepID=UPI0020750D68|nr:Fur family transcriptional regulator [Enterobacter kobei]MCM7487410.1 transcriptional repressor [Enterobacter kobei]